MRKWYQNVKAGTTTVNQLPSGSSYPQYEIVPLGW